MTISGDEATALYGLAFQEAGRAIDFYTTMIERLRVRLSVLASASLGLAGLCLTLDNYEYARPFGLLGHLWVVVLAFVVLAPVVTFPHSIPPERVVETIGTMPTLNHAYALLLSDRQQGAHELEGQFERLRGVQVVAMYSILLASAAWLIPATIKNLL